MVFFSSCNSVKYHAELLNFLDMPCRDIHGKQKQQKRTSTFFDYCKEPSGLLFCTDVAARGLDIPAVDWIIQYDPPDDPRVRLERPDHMRSQVFWFFGFFLFFFLKWVCFIRIFFIIL